MKHQAKLAVLIAAAAGAAAAQSPPLERASRWTIDRSLASARAGGATLGLALTLVTLRDTGWTEQRMADAAMSAARLLAPCGVALERMEVLTYSGGAPALRDLWTPASRELARAVAPTRPAVFFVADTWHRPPFEAEAFGRANTATRPELVHTAARDLPIVVAHELVHVLTGSGEHSTLPGNLMREDTSPDATQLTAGQCAALREHALREGLLSRR